MNKDPEQVVGPHTKRVRLETAAARGVFAVGEPVLCKLAGQLGFTTPGVVEGDTVEGVVCNVIPVRIGERVWRLTAERVTREVK